MMTAWKSWVEKCFENPWKMQRRFAQEVLEIHEIAERLVERVDQKIKALRQAEAQADQKIALLDGLLTRYKNLAGGPERVGEEGSGRQQRVRSLAEKGFSAEQIARILDAPAGEVELMLNLAE